ncbi:D-alanyl-lipoteichoic acid biosynthesis protein DltD [Staphylococcus equorum]|uniref:D-alanyl-lipoteichoic acid biosynthesis protein DltD n=2 Tax=Staphylococcus equorum TaxID=246432 RepID=UPI000853A9D1|nr:D-alanyl-lipoteichoic acid biosynthesis protein DltD [Staphylococcus equorum]MCE5048045.1 D-alanyl-lipoteichoic acid biosynthesis protein DltD [Staphylococcus equorum]MEB7690874.1 D-alanyl-lipoteichoic acid biosynthesis protein DltD [Staphylococcus equorum]MEB7835147.1 D-alanyl-lipoteichoic acid biosynthesis protein DltD [Staphylococcus equorum]MEB8172752.1 D-alanyl-lipoteichoic acid biosynthesis protein DltD [Staphylococcus equorum]OEK76643.1 D-alanyl-lipoteichoic acid biosynthesis protein
MKLKPFIPIIASLILFGIFLAIPVSWFTGLINSKTLETQRISLSDQVLKGTLIQDKMYESDAYYPIYGSSELEKDDPFNPALLINNDKNIPEKPFLIGTGGSTDLVNAVEIGSQYDNLKGKKIAFIVSPQWFTNNGLTSENFKARIAKGQLNQLFKQNKLSPELKQRFAKRLLQFKDAENKAYLKKVAQQPQNVKDTYISSFTDNQLKKIELIKAMFPLTSSPLSQVKPVTQEGQSWEDIQKQAEKYGEARTKSNEFGIRDEYWDLIKSHKRKINRDYEFNINSPEFNDLALLVDTLNEAGADVEYIILPSNGKWYDYIGIDKQRRQGIYKKINQTIVEHGGDVYDMSDKDYEPYVVSDAVHIGWKGWVYISERINQHLQE